MNQEVIYYHPKRHPEECVRMSYQDGWTKTKLGTDGTKRYPDGDKVLAFLCGFAKRVGSDEAAGEFGDTEIPAAEDIRAGRAPMGQV